MRERKLLEELRSKLAFAKKGKHSWSFSDVELESLLKAKPKTLEELGVIKGFPRKGKRVEAYGSSIIDIFNGKGIDSFSVKSKGEDIEVSTVLKKASFF